MASASNPISIADHLRQLRAELARARRALKSTGADPNDPVYATVYKSLREAERLSDSALQRIDQGLSVSHAEADEIARLLDEIRSTVF